ncbi:hypothetical protein SNK19_08945 [Ralstonia pseudosolanacearum]|uniref:hypothetical protein n=1 Tax=Ralstonia pseudosolanacearum TaxID=1310165 RepID=UPI0012EE0FDB|nr:hypothetical protein [Ralstonia pseudosolanacearum]MCQ4681076.1 hypothetical protein [Ralstonia pseudosolanacearum]MDC6283744.1 hypothetical protein [Ralstonia pseudosolanacearum]
MRTRIETSPTGFRYIAILEPVDWGSALDKVREILSLIDAQDIVAVANEDAISVDTKWWEFKFKGRGFRVIYEEWPSGLSIEPKCEESASLLSEIEKLILVT